MVDETRGITCPDMRRVIREALAGGWEWGGIGGGTHGRIVWPADGTDVRFGLTPSVGSWKTVASQIQRVSGVVVWRRGNKKRSRKATRPSGFTMEDTGVDDSFRRAVASLTEDRERLIGVCRHYANTNRFRELPGLLARVTAIEDRLAHTYCQPVERFDPHTLAPATESSSLG
jgi:hypothetical protein